MHAFDPEKPRIAESSEPLRHELQRVSDRSGAQEQETESSSMRLARAIEGILSYGSAALKEAIDRHDKQGAGHVLVVGDFNTHSLVLGTTHTNKPDSTTVKNIEDWRDAYLARVPKEEALFMVEGMHDADLSPEGIKNALKGIDSEKKAVETFGEGGALLWKAKEFGIDVSSPEKSSREIAEDLKAKGFSAADLSTYLTLRQFTSDLGRPHGEKTTEQNLLDFARTFYDIERTTDAGWISSETKRAVDAAAAQNDLPELTKLARQVLHEYVDQLNRSFAATTGADHPLVPTLDALLERNENLSASQQISIETVNAFHDPLDDKGKPNQVSAAWNAARDQYLVEQISDAIAKGKKPLVVFGATHAMAIGPAVRILNE